MSDLCPACQKPVYFAERVLAVEKSVRRKNAHIDTNQIKK